MKLFTIVAVGLLLIATSASSQNKKPNIIFILGDDIGYDLLTVNGGQSFSTPNLDEMARKGMNFTHCESAPLCAPSRMMLLTGKQNYRNYTNWGFLSDTAKTIGNLMKDAGYNTGFFGKLQLQSTKPMNQWGWNKFTCFEIMIDSVSEKSRYKSPTLKDNNGIVPDTITKGKYCDDILTSEIIDFIDSNKNNPFFIYYPMSIGHNPFCPTPDDSGYAAWDGETEIDDPVYFPSMVKYMDKKVGEIVSKLKSSGLDTNTIIFFAGDNGTPTQINYQLNGETVTGEKGFTKEGGTHVPLIVYWPGHIQAGSVNEDLIDFTDFFPTLADLAGNKNLFNYGILDGLSFSNRLSGKKDTTKSELFNHYNPHPGGAPLNRWVRDKQYKLYDSTGFATSGKFYNIIQNAEETHPLVINNLTEQEKIIIERFRNLLDTTGFWPGCPLVNDALASDITSSGAVLSANIINEGASSLIERGSNIRQDDTAYYYSSVKKDSIAALGNFSQKRSKLLPQQKYFFSLYAMNANASNNTGYGQGVFYTLSKPPIKQPGFFAVKDSGCFLHVSWDSAAFPSSGATKAGYLILYSTANIYLRNDANGHAPSNISVSGSRFISINSDLPFLPSSFADITSFSSDSSYNFMLIPYTYDGINDATYNYLSEYAFTAVHQPAHTSLKLSYTSNNLLCYNDKSGNISAGALGGFTPFMFNLNGAGFNSDSAFTGLDAGLYKVELKDNMGCRDSATVILTQPALLTMANQTASPLCYGNKTGSVVIKAKGGVTPLLYSINNNSYLPDSSFSQLGAGNYFIKVKDNNGCIDSTPVVLTEPQAIKASYTTLMSLCNAKNSGSISIAASGGVVPYKYSLNNSSYTKDSTYKKLSSGIYKISVKDSNNCVVSSGVTVGEPDAIIVKITTVSPSCKENKDASIKVEAEKGIAPYTYQLNKEKFSTVSEFKNLAAGSYTVSVKDKNGCLSISEAVIKEASTNCFNGISVAPNPAKYQFTIRIGNNYLSTEVSIRVSDACGRILYNENATGNSTYTFGGKLPAGIYFVYITAGKDVYTFKVVKQ